jgi:hypothetical protein
MQYNTNDRTIPFLLVHRPSWLSRPCMTHGTPPAIHVETTSFQRLVTPSQHFGDSLRPIMNICLLVENTHPSHCNTLHFPSSNTPLAQSLGCRANPASITIMSCHVILGLLWFGAWLNIQCHKSQLTWPRAQSVGRLQEKCTSVGLCTVKQGYGPVRGSSRNRFVGTPVDDGIVVPRYSSTLARLDKIPNAECIRGVRC